MKNTTNYKLKKPEGTDVVNVEDFNANANIIDTKLKELETNEIFYSVATGSANNYIVSIPALSSLTGYYDGLAICVKINLSSTGASTVNANGWGAKSIVDSLGNPIGNGGFKKDMPYNLRYNGVNFILQAKGGGGNVTADKLLIGYKATGDTGEVVGTMPDNGAINITPGSKAQTIPPGYTSGGTVAGDSNLISDYILGTKSIYGIEGKASNVDTSDALATASQLLAGASAYVNGLKVLGSIQSRSATTYNPSTTAQTIPQGLYLSGAQTIAPVTGTSNVGHVLAGYTFSSANGINLTGNIPSKGATTITPGTSTQTIASNQYLSGAITVLGDPELIANNILNGVDIFGVTGNVTLASLGGKKTAFGVTTTATLNLSFTPDVVIIYLINQTDVTNYSTGTVLKLAVHESSTGLDYQIKDEAGNANAYIQWGGGITINGGTVTISNLATGISWRYVCIGY